MKPNLLIAILCAGVIAVPGAAYPDSRVDSAVELLKSEIERDKEIIGSDMNIIRLRQTRTILADDLEKKQGLADRLGSMRYPTLKRAVEIVAETLEDEKTIVGTRGITWRYQRQTYYKIKNNIAKKEEALRDFENWQKGQ